MDWRIRKIVAASSSQKHGISAAFVTHLPFGARSIVHRADYATVVANHFCISSTTVRKSDSCQERLEEKKLESVNVGITPLASKYPKQ
eukprot:6490868-Amphidinium_carterae.2